MSTSNDRSLKKVSRTKSKARSNSLKSLRKSLKSRSKSLKSRSKSLSRSLRSMSPTWSSKYSECPKTPLHQLTVDRHKSNWIKLNVTRDVNDQ